MNKDKVVISLFIPLTASMVCASRGTQLDTPIAEKKYE